MNKPGLRISSCPMQVDAMEHVVPSDAAVILRAWAYHPMPGGCGVIVSGVQQEIYNTLRPGTTLGTNLLRRVEPKGSTVQE